MAPKHSTGQDNDLHKLLKSIIISFIMIVGFMIIIGSIILIISK
jgi:hypothetical protein